MPRNRKRKRRPKTASAGEFDYKAKSPTNIPDSGETLPVEQAPENIDIGDDDDEFGDDPWGDQDGLTRDVPPRNDPPPIPPPPGSQPDNPGFERPRLSNADFEGGDYVLTNPVIESNVVDDKRIHLTWIVNDVSIQYISEEGVQRPEIRLRAMLAACLYELVPVEQGGRREPVLNVQRLFEKPVVMALPLWLLPPELVQNPHQITLERAEKALAQMFTSFPSEIIKPAPPPAELERIPMWLRQQLAQKGGPRT